MIARKPSIALTVLGGYLGAGKTTLLNHILRSTTERIVVLVNDFGSINIDESLIAAADEDKITLANGCICCSLVDGLASALEQVRSFTPAPARLVIEASGVSNPASIAAYAHGRGLHLDGVVTVIDAETIRARINDRYVGDTVRRQIVAADLLILNKTDLIAPAELIRMHTWLSSLGDLARPVINAVQGQVSLDALLGSSSLSANDAEAQNHAEAAIGFASSISIPSASSTITSPDSSQGKMGQHPLSSQPEGGTSDEPVDPKDLFASWSFSTDQTFDQTRLQAILSSWSPNVVRVKGIVRIPGEPHCPDQRAIIHRVGLRLTFTPDGPWIEGPSTLVAIGLRGLVDIETLDHQVRSSL